METSQFMRQGLELRTPSGTKVFVGPEAAQGIRREALTAGLQVLDEIRTTWSEIAESEGRPDRQQIEYIKRQVHALPSLLQTVTAFAQPDEYWAGQQSFGPR